MTGQPHLRQVRILGACAAAATAMVVGLVCLVRLECDWLAGGAATERALRNARQERLERLNAAWFRLALAGGSEEFAAFETGWKAWGDDSARSADSRVLLEAVRDRMVARERPSEASGALAAALQRLERASQADAARIREAEKRQESALQQVPVLSMMILLAVLSGAALLLSAGRILSSHFRRELGALQSLYKHTVRKTNHILDKVGSVASAVSRVAERLPSADARLAIAANRAQAPAGTGDPYAGALIDSARDGIRALQSDLTAIGRVTEQVRGMAFQTTILGLQSALDGADSCEQGAGLEAEGAASGECAATGPGRPAIRADVWTAKIDAQIRALEARAAGIGATLAELRQFSGLPDEAAVASGTFPRMLAPEQEQLYRLAATMEALCGKQVPDSMHRPGANRSRSKSTPTTILSGAGADRAGNSVLTQSVPAIWP